MMKKSKIHLGTNLRNELQNVIDSPRHTVYTTEGKIRLRKMLSTPGIFRKTRKKEVSLIKHRFRRAGGNVVSPSEKPKNKEEGILAESKPKVRKIDSKDEGSEFEKPVDLHEKISEPKSKLKF